MGNIAKFTVVMYKGDKSETKDVYATNATVAMGKADPKGKFSKYTVYQGGKEVKTRTRI